MMQCFPNIKAEGIYKEVGVKGWGLARSVDNFTAICEQIA
jgi:hypothetical protein